MSRKGRTGLEWLLEKEKSSASADSGSGGAAVAAETAAKPAPPPGDVDAALAALDLNIPPPAPKVVARMPAEASLAHDADLESTPPPKDGSGTARSRSADGLANALLHSEKPKPPAKADEPKTDEPRTGDAKAEGRAAPTEANAETAKPSAPAPDPAAGGVPATAEGSGGEPASWQTARTGKMAGVKRSPAEEIRPREVDEPEADLADAESSVPEVSVSETSVTTDDDEPSARFDVSVAAEEPSMPPPSVDDVLGAVTERHKKAVSSGRSTRAHPRAKASFEVRYKKSAEPLAGKGRNVSLGGFFVETTRLLPEGEVFSAQLFFDQRKLSVIAEVMWTTMGDSDDLDRFPPGMGCKFLDTDERDLPFLQGVIEASLATGGAVP